MMNYDLRRNGYGGNTFDFVDFVDFVDFLTFFDLYHEDNTFIRRYK